MDDPVESHPLDIPAFLKRGPSNKAEFMNMTDSVEVSAEVEKPRRAAKAKVAAKPTAKAATKKAAKPVAKAAPKAKAKAAKAPEKAKAAKPKASGEGKDQFGLRKGSAKSQAAALYARKRGASIEEVKEAVGSVQLNVLKGLEGKGFKVERVKEERKGQRPVTRYILHPK